MRRVALTFVAALIVVASAAGSVNGSALNRTTFDDALGEDPAAPDIATVRVSNDDEGTLTFRIALPNRPTLARRHAFLAVDRCRHERRHGARSGSGIDYRLLYDFYLHGDRLLWLLTCGTSVCSSGDEGAAPLRAAARRSRSTGRSSATRAASASSSTRWTASSSTRWHARSTSRTRTATPRPTHPRLRPGRTT